MSQPPIQRSGNGPGVKAGSGQAVTTSRQSTTRQTTTRQRSRRAKAGRQPRRRPLVYAMKPGDMLEFNHSGKRAREKVILFLTDGIRVKHKKAGRSS